MANRASLADDLRRLGVTPGDVLFVHSSFKSLGPVDNGAADVVAALEDAVGPAGLILMPSFNLVPGPDNRARTWNLQTTPSTVGWITEFFRTMPGTVRSDHYSHSVAARGKAAASFVADHGNTEGMPSPWDREPWGKTYGRHSPMIKACDAAGKVLLLGAPYKSVTYMHVIEVMLWDRNRQADPQAKYRWIQRPVLGERWDEIGRLNRGPVAQADCRLFPIRDFVDTLLTEVQRDPQKFLSD